MSLLRIVLFLFLLLLVLVFGVASYLHVADLNQYKEQIAARVQEATGRDFTMGSLDVQMWPRVKVSVDDVALANAPWGSDPLMLQLGHLETTIKPLSLLFGHLRVTEFVLEDMNLLLESNDSGDSNWEMATGPESTGQGGAREGDDAAGGSGDGLPVRLDNLRISDVIVTLREPGSEDLAFLLERLRLQPDADKVRRLTGSGVILNQPLVLNGQFGKQSGGGSEPFQVNGNLGSLELAVNSVQGSSGARDDNTLETLLRTEDLAAFLASIGVSTPLSGPLLVKAVITPGKRGTTTSIDAELDTTAARLTLEREGGRVAVAGELEGLAGLGTMLGLAGLPIQPVVVEGALNRDGDGLEIDALRFTSGGASLSATGRLRSGERNSTLQVKLEGESLSDLLTTLPGLPFEGTAQLQSSVAEIAIDPLQLRFGKSDLAGSIRMLSGDEPATTIALTSATLHLKEFLGISEDAEPQEAPAEQDKPYVFTEDLLPFETLQQNEVDIDIAVDQLIGPASTLENVEIVAGLHAGELKAAFDFSTPVGARSASRLQLTTRGQQADLRATINARDMRLNLASGEDALPEEIPPVSLSFNVVASGDSPRTLASSSTGDLLVTLGEGRLVNKLIGRFSGDIVSQLSSALNPFAKEEPDTTFECGLASIAIEDGRATIEPIILQGQKVTIAGQGKLDLKTEEIMIKFNTQPREGIGIGADMFVTPFVALDGTLANPRVGANKSGTAITVATGGISLLVRSAMDRLAGSVDHCAETMPNFPQPPLPVD